MTTRQSARWLAFPWLVACAMAVLGCDPPPTSIPPGEPPSVSTAPPPVRPPPPARPPQAVEEPVDAGAVTPPPGEPSAPVLAAVGAACDIAADCESGVCEGEGCGPKRGRCVARGRVCTRDRRAYCGCDGNTFYSSGSCPGARFASRGECGKRAAAGAADGAACKAAADCQSGICEGEGCGAASSGVCVSRKRPCTADLRAYCGCDGATFNASSSCPGRRYASRGECKK